MVIDVTLHMTGVSDGRTFPVPFLISRSSSLPLLSSTTTRLQLGIKRLAMP
jgi:hypothetical protein